MRGRFAEGTKTGAPPMDWKAPSGRPFVSFPIRAVGSTLSVSDVGQACGYDSLQSFSRTFRKMLGLSPLAYRNLNADKY